MFCVTTFIYFFQNTKTFYREIEGTFERVNTHQFTTLKIETGKYYWFEFSNERYLFIFDNNLQFNKNSFILFVIVPMAKSKSWPDLEGDQLLISAFDNFHETSAFLSLLPNEQNRNVYSIFININNRLIYGWAKLEDDALFMSPNFPLQKLTKCSALLEKTKIRTISWNCFYKVKDTYYGFFMKTYFIFYQERNEHVENIVIFKAADLSELGYLVFTLDIHGGKVFLNDKDDFLWINRPTSIMPVEPNKYRLGGLFSVSTFDIIFDLEKDKIEEFQFLVKNPLLRENTEIPLIEKLPQIGKNHYILNEDHKKRFILEVPVYFFRRKLEISKLIVVFWFIIEHLHESPTAEGYFQLYDFTKTENIFSFRPTGSCRVSFEYFVENESVTFKPTNITFVGIRKEFLTLTKVKKTFDITEKEIGILKFVNGAIIYDPNSIVTLFRPETYKERQIEPELESKYKELKKKGKKLVYMLMGFILVSVCLLVRFYFRYIRKWFHKRRKFKRR